MLETPNDGNKAATICASTRIPAPSEHHARNLPKEKDKQQAKKEALSQQTTVPCGLGFRL